MKVYCCICDKVIKDKKDMHNPDPLGRENDVCCSECNTKYVIPSRKALWKIPEDEYDIIKPYLRYMTKRDLANTLRRKNPVEGFVAFKDKCEEDDSFMTDEEMENNVDWIIHAVTDAYEHVDSLSGLVNLHTHGLEKYGMKNLSTVVEFDHIEPVSEIMNNLARQMIEDGEFEPECVYTQYNEDETEIDFCFTVVESYDFGEPTLRIVFENDEGNFVSIFLENEEEDAGDNDVADMWSGE